MIFHDHRAMAWKRNPDAVTDSWHVYHGRDPDVERRRLRRRFRAVTRRLDLKIFLRKVRRWAETAILFTGTVVLFTAVLAWLTPLPVRTWIDAFLGVVDRCFLGAW